MTHGQRFLLRYLAKLLDTKSVARFIKLGRPEILEQFEIIVETMIAGDYGAQGYGRAVREAEGHWAADKDDCNTGQSKETD